MLVAVLDAPPSPGARELQELRSAVRYLEVRADIVGDLKREWFDVHFGGSLLYSLRSKDQGGSFDGDDAERRRRLLWAVHHYDLVDLEPRDLTGDFVAQIPAHRRVISSCLPTADVNRLRSEFALLAAKEASLYRMTCVSSKASDELAPLELLAALGRRDVVAWATGPSGCWSQLVAPYVGAPAVFGTVSPCPNGHGFSMAQLTQDYGLPTSFRPERLFGIVGGHVGHSHSPRLHNAAYRALGLPALYVPFSVHSFHDFWRRVVASELLATCALPIDGFSLAAPHKETALAAAQFPSELATRAGAANVLARSYGMWRADTADADGVLLPLWTRGIDVRSKPVAVIGCGGAGRSAIAALSAQGAAATLINRTVTKGTSAAEMLGVPFVPLSKFEPERYAIIVNATPVDRNDEEPPFDVKQVLRNTVVIDFSHGSEPTPLVRAAPSRQRSRRRARGVVPPGAAAISRHDRGADARRPGG